MPIYEFQCRTCGEVFERIMRIDAAAEGISCPACGASAPTKRFASFQTNAWSGFLDAMEKRVNPHKFQ